MKKLLLSVFVSLIISCGGAPKVDPSSAQITSADKEMINIPEVCKSYYESDKPRVAVSQFLNNTSYGDMQATNTSFGGRANSTSVGAGVSKDIGRKTTAGVGVSQTNTKFTGQADTYMRDVAPKIGEYAQSATENLISNIGGMDIYDRSSLESILSEQKFQMAIADPDTAVMAGKLAGVQYIFTGTVDSINAKYVPPLAESQTGNPWVDLAVSLTRVASSPVTGWHVTVEMTVKMIDIETGSVIINQKVVGSQVAGGGQGLNPDLISEAAKRAMGKAITEITPAIDKLFAPKAYIRQLRGDKSIALINAGTRSGLKSGEELVAYDLMEIVDPFTGDKTCSLIKIPVELVVSDQIESDQSWIKIKGKSAPLERVKNGVIVMRK